MKKIPNHNFNSIKVRLKLNPAFALSNIAQFQFHKGTIKTHSRNLFLGNRPIFQFHKGTIKTVTRQWHILTKQISIP